MGNLLPLQTGTETAEYKYNSIQDIESDGMNHFESAPIVLCYFVFDFLEWKDYLKLSFVCQKWKTCVEKNWQKRFKRDFGAERAENVQNGKWKEEYIKLFTLRQNALNGKGLDMKGCWNDKRMNYIFSLHIIIKEKKECEFATKKMLSSGMPLLGKIIWSIVYSSYSSSIGHIAIEYLAGKYDEEAGEFQVQGIEKGGEGGLIALATYKLKIDEHGTSFNGISIGWDSDMWGFCDYLLSSVVEKEMKKRYPCKIN